MLLFLKDSLGETAEKPEVILEITKVYIWCLSVNRKIVQRLYTRIMPSKAVFEDRNRLSYSVNLTK